MRATMCCEENAHVEQIEGIGRNTNMSVNLKNQVFENKLSCKEWTNEGVLKYAKDIAIR